MIHLTGIQEEGTIHNMHTRLDRKQFRLKASTHRDLRFIYAETGENMVNIIDRLVKAERERLESEREQKEKNQ